MSRNVICRAAGIPSLARSTIFNTCQLLQVQRDESLQETGARAVYTANNNANVSAANTPAALGLKGISESDKDFVLCTHEAAMLFKHQEIKLLVGYVMRNIAILDPYQQQGKMLAC